MKVVIPEEINDAALLSTNVTEDLYPNYSSGTSYGLGARVHVVSENVHHIYESLVAGNLGNPPATSDTKWQYVSFTNPWAMFDNSVTTQTSNADSIDVSLQTTGYVLAIGLMNVSGVEVEVTMTDPIEGVVYNETHSLVSDSGVDDWFDYFFEPIVRLNDVLITGLPACAATIIDISVRSPGEIVKCGTVVLGPSIEVGSTQYGAGLGIDDYSVKTQDDFGNYSILERSFRKRADFTILVPEAAVDATMQMLAERRATPTLYIGADDYTSTMVFGFYKGFRTEIAYPAYSLLTIDIEGLT